MLERVDRILHEQALLQAALDARHAELRRLMRLHDRRQRALLTEQIVHQEESP